MRRFHVALVLMAACAPAQEIMPVAQQNALVKAYCAVCHTDAAKNGGLTLQHFDAASASPSLVAMMLSKLNSGALGASGQPVPDMEATENALKRAFALESKGATEWFVERGPVVTASILREAGPESYRLLLTCDAAAKQGSMQLAWSPAPQSGSLSLSVDGRAAVQVAVQGSEAMGNGSGQILTGRAAVSLEMALPVESVTIRDLFPGQAVTFPGLPPEVRRELAACAGLRGN